MKTLLKIVSCILALLIIIAATFWFGCRVIERRSFMAGFVDVFLRLGPANIGLKECNFQYSRSLMDDFPLNDTTWSMR